MNKTRAVLVTIVLTLGFTVAVSAPAHASLSECPVGTVCGWDTSNFTGMLFSHTRSGGSCYNVPFNNRANSFYHRTYRGVQMYKDANCTGPLLRDWNGNTGPFRPGHLSVFYRPFCCGDGDQNDLTSVFFNTA